MRRRKKRQTSSSSRYTTPLFSEPLTYYTNSKITIGGNNNNLLGRFSFIYIIHYHWINNYYLKYIFILGKGLGFKPYATSDPGRPNPTLGSALAAFMALASITLLSSTPENGILPGKAPAFVAQPGSQYGGGLPNDFSNPDLALSLGLVPPGLSPVSVFPPFDKKHTFPAVAVIFTEGAQIQRRTNNPVNVDFHKMQETILNWRRNIKCYGPRRCNPYKNAPGDEPLYGFRVKVTLIDNQDCDIESTCLTSIGELPLDTRPKNETITLNTTYGELFTSSKPSCQIQNVCG